MGQKASKYCCNAADGINGRNADFRCGCEISVPITEKQTFSLVRMFNRSERRQGVHIDLTLQCSQCQLHVYPFKVWLVRDGVQMIEYQGVIFLGALISGFAPITIIIAFCILTGRTAALFSNKNVECLDSSPFIRMMMRLYLILLPAYIVLLCVYVFLNLI